MSRCDRAKISIERVALKVTLQISAPKSMKDCFGKKWDFSFCVWLRSVVCREIQKSNCLFHIIDFGFFCISNTTHVVFKDGLQSTYTKAKSWNIPIVSILWIEACKKHLILMDPKEYPIANIEKYENPDLYGKAKVNNRQQQQQQCRARVLVRYPSNLFANLINH